MNGIKRDRGTVRDYLKSTCFQIFLWFCTQNSSIQPQYIVVIKLYFSKIRLFKWSRTVRDHLKSACFRAVTPCIFQIVGYISKYTNIVACDLWVKRISACISASNLLLLSSILFVWTRFLDHTLWHGLNHESVLSPHSLVLSLLAFCILL